MPTSRDLVIKALNYQTPARVPKDLGGMRSTCISAFAYPKLVAALGLPPRLPRVEDTGQMLALPELDVLDALGVDVVTILDGVTNALPLPEQADLWHAYDFHARLPALVRWPQNFENMPDGTVLQHGRSRMVPDSYVFDEEHAGQPLDLSDDLPKIDLKLFRKSIQDGLITDEQVKVIRSLCKRVREASDRAVFFNDGAVQAWMGIGAHSGLAIFPMLCITEPDYVAELHEIVTERSLYNLRAILPEIREYVDVIMLTADDWGTQNNLIASPKVYRKLFLPYYQRINAEFHRVAPQVKSFMHNCGAVYDLIDLVVESGFDILNPVQWPAGGHSYREWKDKARGRISLWGGGVNAQATLPLGTVADVRREVSEVVGYMAQDGGFVFCNIHNILAEISPEKVIAMYQSAG
jgi:uroporphyrinogen decarboxylase